MYRLHYTREAQAALIEIADYIAEESGYPEIGEAFAARLCEQCAKLAASIGTLGVARPELRSDLRCTPFENYLIFFRYRDQALEIVAVLESHRDAGRYFQQS